MYFSWFVSAIIYPQIFHSPLHFVPLILAVISEDCPLWPQDLFCEWQSLITAQVIRTALLPQDISLYAHCYSVPLSLCHSAL